MVCKIVRHTSKLCSKQNSGSTTGWLPPKYPQTNCPDSPEPGEHTQAPRQPPPRSRSHFQPGFSGGLFLPQLGFGFCGPCGGLGRACSCRASPLGDSWGAKCLGWACRQPTGPPQGYLCRRFWPSCHLGFHPPSASPARTCCCHPMLRTVARARDNGATPGIFCDSCKTLTFLGFGQGLQLGLAFDRPALRPWGPAHCPRVFSPVVVVVRGGM